MEQILSVSVWDNGEGYHTTLAAKGTISDLIFAMSEVLHGIISQMGEDDREKILLEVIKKTIHHP